MSRRPASATTTLYSPEKCFSGNLQRKQALCTDSTIISDTGIHAHPVNGSDPPKTWSSEIFGLLEADNMLDVKALQRMSNVQHYQSSEKLESPPWPTSPDPLAKIVFDNRGTSSISRLPIISGSCSHETSISRSPRQSSVLLGLTEANTNDIAKSQTGNDSNIPSPLSAAFQFHGAYQELSELESINGWVSRKKSQHSSAQRIPLHMGTDHPYRSMQDECDRALQPSRYINTVKGVDETNHLSVVDFCLWHGDSVSLANSSPSTILNNSITGASIARTMSLDISLSTQSPSPCRSILNCTDASLTRLEQFASKSTNPTHREAACRATFASADNEDCDTVNCQNIESCNAPRNRLDLYSQTSDLNEERGVDPCHHVVLSDSGNTLADVTLHASLGASPDVTRAGRYKTRAHGCSEEDCLASLLGSEWCCGDQMRDLADVASAKQSTPMLSALDIGPKFHSAAYSLDVGHFQLIRDSIVDVSPSTHASGDAFSSQSSKMSMDEVLLAADLMLQKIIQRSSVSPSNWKNSHSLSLEEEVTPTSLVGDLYPNPGRDTYFQDYSLQCRTTSPAPDLFSPRRRSSLDHKSPPLLGPIGDDAIEGVKYPSEALHFSLPMRQDVITSSGGEASAPCILSEDRQRQQVSSLRQVRRIPGGLDSQPLISKAPCERLQAMLAMTAVARKSNITYTDDHDRMIYISWIPKQSRAYTTMDRRRMELQLKKKLREDLHLEGITKVLLFPPKGAHCKVIFDKRKSAEIFMTRYGGDDGSAESEKWKYDICKAFHIVVNDRFAKTVVKVEWSKKQISNVEELQNDIHRD